MEFKIVGIIGTLIFLMASILVFQMMNSKLGKSDRTVRDVLNSALSGTEDSVHHSPDFNYDICEYLGATYGCENELGAEGECYLRKGNRYLVTASPSAAGVCLKIEEVG